MNASKNMNSELTTKLTMIATSCSMNINMKSNNGTSSNRNTMIAERTTNTAAIVDCK